MSFRFIYSFLLGKRKTVYVAKSCESACFLVFFLILVNGFHFPSLSTCVQFDWGSGVMSISTCQLIGHFHSNKVEAEEFDFLFYLHNIPGKWCGGRGGVCSALGFGSKLYVPTLATLSLYFSNWGSFRIWANFITRSKLNESRHTRVRCQRIMLLTINILMDILGSLWILIRNAKHPTDYKNSCQVVSLCIFRLSC